MWFELYEDGCKRTKEPWRWRLRSGDLVVALSVEGYPDEEQCRCAVKALTRISVKTPIRTRAKEKSAGAHANVP
ncbi:hypothetical protein RugamoR1_28700 [Rugamonas sp. R1(2021)]|jgi:uncharacterized protein YegP (UPF0339 family)